MTGAAEGGRSKKAPTRAAKKKPPARGAKKAPTRARKKAPVRGPTKGTAKKASPAAKSVAASAKITSGGSSSPTGGVVFDKVRALCLALPDTKLTMTWGSPHFRVGEKIFCGFGVEDGKATLGVKLELSHARRVVKDARFWPSPYVGKHGWVTMNLSLRESWNEVEALIRESYGLIAPRASQKKLR